MMYKFIFENLKWLETPDGIYLYETCPHINIDLYVNNKNVISIERASAIISIIKLLKTCLENNIPTTEDKENTAIFFSGSSRLFTFSSEYSYSYKITHIENNFVRIEDFSDFIFKWDNNKQIHYDLVVLSEDKVEISLKEYINQILPFAKELLKFCRDSELKYQDNFNKGKKENWLDMDLYLEKIPELENLINTVENKLSLLIDC